MSVLSARLAGNRTRPLERPLLGCIRGVGGGLIVVVPLLNRAVAPDAAIAIPDYLVPLLGKYLCYAILALSLDLIWGYAGILSLGHGAFFALGGYAMGMYLMRQIGTRGVYQNPVLPDFMVFLQLEGIAVVLVGLRPFRLCDGDGGAGAGSASPWCSAGSPSARASPASICRSSPRQ